MSDRDDDLHEPEDEPAMPFERRHTDRHRPGVAIVVLIGLGILITSNLLVADDGAPAEDTVETGEAVTTDDAVEADRAVPIGEADAGATSEAPPPPGSELIPRDALVDMTRAQSGVICSSEAFLACMGFDGTECLTLSETAIDECLMPLPAEIDPTTLDNATLEACPTAIYEQAGHDAEKADTCFIEALDGS